MFQIALTLLAHPDDAEILCAGTLIRLADAGWQVHIATATPGDCGTMTETRWDISATRTNEARAARRQLPASVCFDPSPVQNQYRSLFRGQASSAATTKGGSGMWTGTPVFWV